MARYDFDLFVIGGGSGGVRAARMTAAMGRRVAIAEESRYGGTCVIRGCVPKKLLVYASHLAEEIEDAIGYGWEIESATFRWDSLIANKDREIDRLNAVYLRLLDRAGVVIVQGRAILADAHTVEVGDRRYTAETILVATGARPIVPDWPGAELAVTSDQAFHLPGLPGHVAIIGGGYIATEFAGIFKGLGAQVSQVYRGSQILRGFDTDLRATVAEEMAKKGIAFHFGEAVARIDRTEAGLVLVLASGHRIPCDTVMAATGRRPYTAGLGLEAAGVALKDNGAIAVDAWSRSSVPSIYAVGDVTDRLNLTPVAIAEAMAFVHTAFGGTPTALNHEIVPTAVFSQPPAAAVGLTEEQARAAYRAIDIYRTRFTPMKYSLSHRDEKTMMKLVVDSGSGRVLGAHMVGIDAPEIIQALAVAVKMGATKAQFDDTVALHPTAAEEFVTLRDKLPPPAAAA